MTYVCVGYGEDEPPNVIWEFGDQLLSNDTSSLVTIYDSRVVENGQVFTQSILELCSVEVENAGNYSCTANNSRGSNSSTFTLNVRPRGETKHSYSAYKTSQSFQNVVLNLLFQLLLQL